MSIEVVTLVDDGPGPYKLTRGLVGGLSAAHDQAGKLWTSLPRLAALLVFDGAREDARYERPWLDAVRIPESWPARRVEAPREGSQAPPIATPLALPPTMFEEEVTAQASRTGCPACHTLGGGHDEGERDRSPAGRLAARRCPRCGAPWPRPGDTALAIQRAYLAVVEGGSVVVDKGRPR